MNSRVALLGGGAALLLVGAIAGYLYGVSSTPTKTTTAPMETTTLTSTFTAPSTSLDAYEQVSDSFASHMLLISERNPFAIVSQYQENATVKWTGNIGGLQGLYNGTGVIFLLMNDSFIGQAGLFSIGNATQAVLAVSADSAMVNSSFEISGQMYNFGYYPTTSFNGTVSAQDFYKYSASQGAWLISRETWNFLDVAFQYPTPTTGG
jgi:hypothetical protein